MESGFLTRLTSSNERDILRKMRGESHFSGGRIRAWRERIGLSLRELAREAGVDRSTLSRWERGLSAIPGWALTRLEEVLQRKEEERRRREEEREKGQKWVEALLAGEAKCPAFWKVFLYEVPDFYRVIAEDLEGAVKKVLERSFSPSAKARKIFGEGPLLGIFEAYEEGEGGEERKLGQFYIVIHRWIRGKAWKGGGYEQEVLGIGTSFWEAAGESD